MSVVTNKSTKLVRLDIESENYGNCCKLKLERVWGMLEFLYKETRSCDIASCDSLMHVLFLVRSRAFFF